MRIEFATVGDAGMRCPVCDRQLEHYSTVAVKEFPPEAGGDGYYHISCAIKLYNLTAQEEQPATDDDSAEDRPRSYLREGDLKMYRKARCVLCDKVYGFQSCSCDACYCPVCACKMQPSGLPVDIEAEALTRDEALALIYRRYMEQTEILRRALAPRCVDISWIMERM